MAEQEGAEVTEVTDVAEPAERVDVAEPAERVEVTERVDTAALPLTEPTAAPIFDTGPVPAPLQPADPDAVWARDGAPVSEPLVTWDSGAAGPDSGPDSASDSASDSDSARLPVPTAQPASSAAEPAPARSVTVPGQYTALKWWQLALTLIGVWIPAGAIGAGLYHWWVTEIDKSPAVFVTLIYVVSCTVGGLVLAMASSRPLVAALAIAVLTAVFASLITAAPFYGHYFCQVLEAQGGRCLAGILPY